MRAPECDTRPRWKAACGLFQPSMSRDSSERVPSRQARVSTRRSSARTGPRSRAGQRLERRSAWRRSARGRRPRSSRPARAGWAVASIGLALQQAQRLAQRVPADARSARRAGPRRKESCPDRGRPRGSASRRRPCTASTLRPAAPAAGARSHPADHRLTSRAERGSISTSTVSPSLRRAGGDRRRGLTPFGVPGGDDVAGDEGARRLMKADDLRGPGRSSSPRSGPPA